MDAEVRLESLNRYIRLRRIVMLELLASFLVILAAISLVMGYSLTGLIYAFLVTSIIITLVGTLRGRPQE